MRPTLIRLALAAVAGTFVVVGEAADASASQPAPMFAQAKAKPNKPRRKGKRAARKPASESSDAPDVAATEADTPPTDAPSLRRSDAMEFDARLVRGERASGAVYLFHRVPRPLPGVVDLTRRYADLITVPLLHRKTVEPKPKATP